MDPHTVVVRAVELPPDPSSFAPPIAIRGGSSPGPLKLNQAKHPLELHDLGTYTQAELAELFGVGRSTPIEPSSGYALPRPSRSDPASGAAQAEPSAGRRL